MSAMRIAGSVLSIATVSALPMFATPQLVPVERLIRNLATFLENDPNDPQLIYKMARLHYLALANRSSLVPAYLRQGEAPFPAADHMARYFLQFLRQQEAQERAIEALGYDTETVLSEQMSRDLRALTQEKRLELEELEWRPPEPTMDAMHEHAEQAIVHFDKAIALAPDMPLYRLGRASLGEQCLDLELAGKLPRRRVIEPFATLSYAAVRDQYYETFRLALEPELEKGYRPIEGLTGLVSHEAGRAYLRMTEKSEELREGQDQRIEEVRKGVEDVSNLRVRAMTPILIGRTENDTLPGLLDPNATVSFDLDGDGQPRDWPWVRPDTGILVWDPLQRNRIESGHQLFGSVTFFLFHRDGYAALRLLDDNQDGELAGIELLGLAIWRDENGDGLSDATEVQPLWRERITALRTDATPDHTGVLHNLQGARYGDGRLAPTYDWILKPRQARD